MGLKTGSKEHNYSIEADESKQSVYVLKSKNGKYENSPSFAAAASSSSTLLLQITSLEILDRHGKLVVFAKENLLLFLLEVGKLIAWKKRMR
jgi:hypothetical protein